MTSDNNTLRKQGIHAGSKDWDQIADLPSRICTARMWTNLSTFSLLQIRSYKTII